MEEVDAKWKRGHDKRREVIRVVVIQPAETPGLSRPHIESRDHDRGIESRRREIDERQPLDVACPSYRTGHDDKHDGGLDEIAKDDVDAGSEHQRTWHGQDHPDEQCDDELRRPKKHVTEPPLAGTIQRKCDQCRKRRQRCRMKDLQDRKQLVHTTDRGHEVRRNRNQKGIPREIRRRGALRDDRIERAGRTRRQE